jgi:hypothetical protein
MQNGQVILAAPCIFSNPQEAPDVWRSIENQIEENRISAPGAGTCGEFIRASRGSELH